MKSVTLIPKASSFFESMRDIGYTLETALADIIDNSLTAQASSINIFTQAIPDYLIGILDDGHGMSYDELLEAMRYASRDPRSPRNPSDLGRFGLGMKLASLSQCRKLTVVSRKNGITCAGIWDQDHVDEVNEWDLLVPENPESVPFADKLGECGTLVVWENLTNLERSDDQGITQDYFDEAFTEAKTHLELVFHRFLSGEPGLDKCQILINHTLLEPFDPFNSNHPATQKSSVDRFSTEVSFQAFTLPHHSKYENKKDWDHYGGKDGYHKNQGLYLYREKRLIFHGTWLRIARQTGTNKLTRVKVDITNAVDSEWGITLDKSTAKLPRAVRERLVKLVDNFTGRSIRVYRGRGQALVAPAISPPWIREQKNNEINYQINPDNPVIKTFMGTLDQGAAEGFGKILSFISSSFPMDTLFLDMEETPNDVTSVASETNLLPWTLESFDFLLTMASDDAERATDMLKTTEPFRSNWEATESILKEHRNLNV